MVFKLGVREHCGVLFDIMSVTKENEGEDDWAASRDMFRKLNFCVKFCLRERTWLLLNKIKRQEAGRSLRSHIRRLYKAVGTGDRMASLLVGPWGEGEPVCGSGVFDQGSGGNARASYSLGFQPLLLTLTFLFGNTHNVRFTIFTIFKYTI